MITILDNKRKGCHIPYEALCDCGFVKLLSGNVLDIIKTPCDAETIKKRQEIFAALNGEGFHDLFVEAYNAINDFSKTAKMLDDVEMPSIKRVFIANALTDKYLSMLNSIAAIPIKGRFLAALNEYVFSRLSDFQSALGARNKVADFINDSSAFSVHTTAGTVTSADLIGHSERGEYRGLLGNAAKVLDRFGMNTDSRKLGTSIAISPRLTLMLQNISAADELSDSVDEILGAIDFDLKGLKNEFEFYLQMHDFINKAACGRLPFCIAEVSNSKEIVMKNAYNVKISVENNAESVGNDVSCSIDENIIFISGANGGGKTTYIKTVLQNMVLFLAGCPILCESARIYPFTGIYSYFISDELPDKSRYENECRRIYGIFDEAAEGESVIFLNEPFSSTYDDNALVQFDNVLEKAKGKKLILFIVTHLKVPDEYAGSTLTPIVDDSGERTFKLERRASAKSSRCLDILKKHGCDRDSLIRFAETKNGKSTL